MDSYINNFKNENIKSDLEKLHLSGRKNHGKAKVIGIDGCTNGGKTTLAKKLCELVSKIENFKSIFYFCF